MRRIRARVSVSVGHEGASFSLVMARRFLRIQMTPKCSITRTRTRISKAKCPRAPRRRPSLPNRNQSRNPCPTQQLARRRSKTNLPLRRVRRIRWSFRIARATRSVWLGYPGLCLTYFAREPGGDLVEEEGKVRLDIDCFFLTRYPYTHACATAEEAASLGHCLTHIE